MHDFAGQQTVDALKDYGMPGGSSWKQTESDSGAGSTFVTYENADDGAKVELRIGNEAASNGQPQAVKEARVTESFVIPLWFDSQLFCHRAVDTRLNTTASKPRGRLALGLISSAPQPPC